MEKICSVRYVLETVAGTNIRGVRRARNISSYLIKQWSVGEIQYDYIWPFESFYFLYNAFKMLRETLEF